jgi:RNA polymerase sigma-70 factor (ECF subfamily)
MFSYINDLRNSSSDEVLFQRALEGDSKCAKLLIESLSPKAFGLALRIVGDKAAAEDVVQEAFLKLFNGSRFEGRSKISTYFYSIVSNCCIDHLRKNEKHLANDPLEEASLMASQDNPQTSLAKLQQAKDLQALIMQLSPRQRVALSMWAYQDASLLDIAKALDLEVNAANQLLHRAKLALKSLLKWSDHAY